MLLHTATQAKPGNCVALDSPPNNPGAKCSCSASEAELELSSEEGDDVPMRESSANFGGYGDGTYFGLLIVYPCLIYC